MNSIYSRSENLTLKLEIARPWKIVKSHTTHTNQLYDVQVDTVIHQYTKYHEYTISYDCCFQVHVCITKAECLQLQNLTVKS